ncbi:MAG TPA: HEAT repeat domain-containing protein [Tepidisphaeraceae bacterium]|jgi:HEAT repeat protein
MTSTTAHFANRKVEMFGLNDSDVERLVAALSDPDLNSRRLVRGAIRELGSAAVPALIRTLKSNNVATRQAAVEMLRQIDGSADAIPALISALQDSDWLVRL